jgi:hypothetical protein
MIPMPFPSIEVVMPKPSRLLATRYERGAADEWFNGKRADVEFDFAIAGARLAAMAVGQIT